MTDDTDDLLAMYNQLLPILGINFDEEVLSQGHQLHIAILKLLISGQGHQSKDTEDLQRSGKG